MKSIVKKLLKLLKEIKSIKGKDSKKSKENDENDNDWPHKTEKWNFLTSIEKREKRTELERSGHIEATRSRKRRRIKDKFRKTQKKLFKNRRRMKKK